MTPIDFVSSFDMFWLLRSLRCYKIICTSYLCKGTNNVYYEGPIKQTLYYQLQVYNNGKITYIRLLKPYSRREPLTNVIGAMKFIFIDHSSNVM